MPYSYTDNMFLVSWEYFPDLRTLFKEEEMAEGNDYETHLLVSGALNDSGWFDTDILKFRHVETISSDYVLKISVLKETYNYLRIKYSWELDTFLSQIHSLLQARFLVIHELGAVNIAILFNKSSNPLVEMEIRVVPLTAEKQYHRSLDFSNDLERRLNYFLPALVEYHCWNTMFDRGDEDGWLYEKQSNINYETFWEAELPQPSTI